MTETGQVEHADHTQREPLVVLTDVDGVVCGVSVTAGSGRAVLLTAGLPSDPTLVARAMAHLGTRAAVRVDATRQLAEWGLDELAFTTELILSELVTNAIRYAGGPIDVRLLRDRSLICEVADASSTSPHLRYAATTDEGGRGLFLVAQFAEHWGTRYTTAGKIIWVEQRLPGGAHPAAGNGRAPGGV